MENNIEKIAINGFFVYVDKDAEIKEGDYFLDRSDSPNEYDEDIYVVGMGGDAEFANKIGDKIIAASPELNLEGVPTYVEWLAEQDYIKGVYVINGIDIAESSRECFIKGYQTAEKELPTWDDVRKTIELAQTVKDYGDYKPYTEEQIIEQIKKSKQ